MTFTEAEEFWRKQFDKLIAEEDTDRVLFCSADIGMIEAALKAFEERREYEYKAECEKLREALESKPTPHDYLATVTNFADNSGAEKAEATFDVDNYKVTIIAERKEEG